MAKDILILLITSQENGIHFVILLLFTVVIVVVNSCCVCQRSQTHGLFCNLVPRTRLIIMVLM